MKRIFFVLLALVIVACGVLYYSSHNQRARLDVAAVEGTNPKITDPQTGLFPLFHIAKPVGWKAGETPTAAAGLKVQPFATGLDHPRWLLPLANGDVLVAETNAPPKPGEKGIRSWIEHTLMGRAGAGSASPNRITLLRDADGDGIAETRTVLISGLTSPFGMQIVGPDLYIADADALLKVPFTVGQTKIDAKPVKVLDLPGGPINHHWTKNVTLSPDGTKLYISIGSNSNVAENHSMKLEQGRASIWEYDLKTGEHRIYAYGIRNPVGMAWEPETKTLWTVVNERDALGSDIVPDYLAEVQFGGFYGWPWYYWGGIEDSRPKDPDDNNLQDTVIKPDYALGPHTASLGLSFAEGAKLGGAFTNGAFIGQHGSWNRKPFSGYKVIFVPFVKGHPKGLPIDVLTGFLDKDEHARGRPVGVVIDRTGGLLVADDVGNAVWRVSAK